MNISQTLKKNIAWSTISRFATQALSVLTNLMLARSLGVAGFGEFAFISSVIWVGNAVTTFGSDMLLIRKISAQKDYSEISSSLALQLIISILFIVIAILFSSLTTLRVFIFALIPLSFFTISTIALRGTNQIDGYSQLHFIFAFLQFISASIIAIMQANILQLVFLLLLAHILSALIGLLFCIIKIPHFIKNLFIFPNKIFSLARQSFIIGIIGSLRLLYERLAITIFPFLADLSTTGLLSASVRVMDATKLGYIAIFTPLYPEMARDKKMLSHQTGLRLLLLSATFASLIIFLTAKYVIQFLFGVEFESATSALQILAWTLPFYVIVSYYSLGFLAIELEKPVLIALAISLLGLLIMLMVLNQLYGLVGGALAVLSAEILQASLLFIQWRKYAFSKLS